MTNKLEIDCTTGKTTTVSLSVEEQAAYDAQQPVGLAQAQAESARVALRSQHENALVALRPALTGNATTIANDLTALQTIGAALQAGTQPTAAQVLQVLRVILRILALEATG